MVFPDLLSCLIKGTNTMGNKKCSNHFSVDKDPTDPAGGGGFGPTSSAKQIPGAANASAAMAKSNVCKPPNVTASASDWCPQNPGKCPCSHGIYSP